MELRDYQRAAVSAVLTKWQESDRLLGVAPTGSGKTIKFANITKERTASGPVLVLAHRDERIDQVRDKIACAVGVVADKENWHGHPNPWGLTKREASRWIA
jgi:superfamily II DNA or RNA helicase